MEVSNQQFKAYLQWVRSKGKGKLHPRTGHEGPEGEQMYSYSFSNLGTKWRWEVRLCLRNAKIMLDVYIYTSGLCMLHTFALHLVKF